MCRTRVQVLGPKFIENLPSNLYIDSLLQLVGINTNGLPKTLETPPPSATNNTQNNEFFNPGTRCAHCKSICENFDITQCDHCKLVRGNMFVSYTFFLFPYYLLRYMSFLEILPHMLVTAFGRYADPTKIHCETTGHGRQSS